MKKCQAVTSTVKIYFEQKIRKCERVSSDWEENSILVSINQIWVVTFSCNVMLLLIVKDTNETETLLKNVKWNV